MEIKTFLEKIISIDGGGISRRRLFEIPKNDEESMFLQKLLSKKYIEKYIVDEISGGKNYQVEHYRVSEKGYYLFDPWYKRIWHFFTNDIAKIFSLIALIISILVGIKQLGWI